jgi:hypothetical protein
VRYGRAGRAGAPNRGPADVSTADVSVGSPLRDGHRTQHGTRPSTVPLSGAPGRYV